MSPAVAPREAAPHRVGRDGLLRLVFTRDGERTVLARCRYTLPLQVLAPVALGDRAAVVSVLNPSGGLLGGDHLAIDVDARVGAHACLTTPSATKVYRTAGAAASQVVTLDVGPAAIVEWIPDHTIPFAGSAFEQSIAANVADTGTLVLIDAFAAGRVARDELWQFDRLASTVSIRDAAGWLLHDRFVLDASRRAAWHAIGFAEACPYFATIVVVADRGVERFVAAVDAAARRAVDVAAGATALPRRGALVRVLARTAPALTAFTDAVWATARREIVGAPPLALRKP